MTLLAGDNNLEAYGLKDLAEMKRVGSTDAVAVVAEFDRMSDQCTRRYYLTKGQNLERDCVAQLPEINTGDPKALVDFVDWASKTYPAEHYALVLWNHGNGCKDEDIYKMAEQKGVAEQITRGQVRGLAAGRNGRALFRTTLSRLILQAAETERAILFDDTSADFLDSTELHLALGEITRHNGRPLDLLGFDACLMNMLEVDYQVREGCSVVVGSQEVEPGDGWAYDQILSRLIAKPAMSAEALGRVIAETYAGWYRRRYPKLGITQSAVSTAKLEDFAGAVGALAEIMTEGVNQRGALGMIFGALRSAQSFTDRDYIDLAHFCQLLAQADPNGGMGRAAQKVVDQSAPGSSCLVANEHNGSSVANAHGLSIYLPIRTLSPLYSQLEFARRWGWDKFLQVWVKPA